MGCALQEGGGMGEEGGWSRCPQCSALRPRTQPFVPASGQHWSGRPLPGCGGAQEWGAQEWGAQASGAQWGGAHVWGQWAGSARPGGSASAGEWASEPLSPRGWHLPLDSVSWRRARLQVDPSRPGDLGARSWGVSEPGGGRGSNGAFSRGTGLSWLREGSLPAPRGLSALAGGGAAGRGARPWQGLWEAGQPCTG